MLIKIKEIERCGNKDKVELEGTIKKIYPFQERPGKFGLLGYQTIVLEDETGEINVLLNIHSPNEIVKDMEGQKVTIQGAVSEYKGKRNIFGKIKKPEVEKDKEDNGNWEILKLAVEVAKTGKSAEEIIEIARILKKWRE